MNAVKMHLLLGAAVLTFASCNQPAPVEEPQEAFPLPALTFNDIYEEDRVTDYLFEAEDYDCEARKAESKKHFLKAIDLFKNKKQPLLSIMHFEASLQLFPDAKAYFELGNALLKTYSYDKALNCYNMAIALRYSPLASVYYNMAKAEAKISDYSDNYQAIEYLRNAIKNGFSDSTLLRSEPDFALLRESAYYKKLYVDNFVNAEKKTSVFFSIFKSDFPAVSLPFSIDADKVAETGFRKSISYEFSQYIAEMENSAFSRDVSNEFYYVARVKETPAYAALIYSSVEVMGDTLPPVYTFIATYDNNGHQVSQKMFSCHCSPEKIKTGLIEDGELVIKDYKRIWEKDIRSVPFSNNKVVKDELLTTTYYSIDETGNINEIKKINEGAVAVR